MDEKELKQILESHRKWLRGEKGGEMANLRGADLCGADLRRADLREADLYRANLCDADLGGANLYKAVLCGANLCGSYLRGANLCKADLRRANLCEAEMHSAEMHGANLCGANLYGVDVDLCETNLYRADLYGANLCAADLSEKIIQVGPIGRLRIYTIYWVDKDIVQCGCWGGCEGVSLAAFKQRIDVIYPADKPETLRYRREYLAAIALFEMLRGEEE